MKKYYISAGCLTKAKEPRLPYYFPIDSKARRTNGFMPFPRAIGRSKT